MLVAHAPAGYIVGKLFGLFSRDDPAKKNRIVLAGILGSLTPDLDILYQTFVGDAKVNHHLYLSHVPAFWVFFFFLALPVSLILRKHRLILVSFFTGILSHVVLDTPMGGIMWKYPYDKKLIYCIDVPAPHNPYKLISFYGFHIKGWVLNMIEHWSFLYEIKIIEAAFAVFLISFLFNLVKRKV